MHRLGIPGTGMFAPHWGVRTKSWTESGPDWSPHGYERRRDRALRRGIYLPPDREDARHALEDDAVAMGQRPPRRGAWRRGGREANGHGEARERETGAPEGRGRRADVPRHRPGGQGRPDRAPAAGERHPQGNAGSFKRTRPWLFDEQGEIRADRVAEGEYRETLERTHRFLEDIEELL